jgi:hypothetical protein
MSAVVGAFVVETSSRSAAFPGGYLTETASAIVILAGDLAPTLIFVSDLTVAAGGPWTPASLLGLNIWLDATQLALADGARVSAWPNLGSGPATFVSEWDPYAFYKANALNGHGLVRISANGTRIRFTGTGVNKDWTMACVVRNWGPTGGIGGRVISSQYPAGGNVLLGYWDAYMDVGFAGAFFSPDQKIPFNNEWRLYSAWCNSATPEVRLYSSGVFIGGQGASAVSEGFGGTFNISGFNDALDETCNCDIAEVLLYNRPLNDSDRAQVEGYLNTKWFTASAGTVDLVGDLAV